MKEKFKTKGTHSKARPVKPEVSNHEDFKLGQGYGSGESASDSQAHSSKKQFGDNPLPKSGGGYGRGVEFQPREETDVRNQEKA